MMNSHRKFRIAAGIRRFGRNKVGATAVEFALLCVPLMFMLMFGIQAVLIFFLDQALQSAAQAAARQLMTGTAQKANYTQQQFNALACAKATSAFNCGGLIVDVQSAPQFSSVNTAALTPTYNANGQVTNTWSYNPGGPGDIVITRLMYNWPVVGGVFAAGLANQGNGTHLIVATVVTKNEPY